MARDIFAPTTSDACMASAYKKYHAGESLTDDEVRISGGQEMQKRIAFLLELGPQFRLAANELIHFHSAMSSAWNVRKQMRNGPRI